jgi:N6-L-threonylcarbamoyladenine synthase
MIVLGIETSCDETAAAVVTAERRILADEVFSQIEDHRPFGGVVPEVAARAHLELIDGVVERALRQSGVTLDDIDAVAATGGPGLIGGVLVGVMTAKAIATVKDVPFIAVNHLEGHALTARLTDDVQFPYLLLLVSGGHCQLLIVEGVGQYRQLGTTLDDALGEAFDKTAKMLGLGFPGGPAVERVAATGDAGRFDLPRPLKGRDGADFSFSGLKTKVRQTIEGLPPGDLRDQDVADLCASFQAAAGDVLADRVTNAMAIFRLRHTPTAVPNPALVVAGGVAANRVIRERLKSLSGEQGFQFIAPPPNLCTDNAAMIAWAGIERLRMGQTDGMDFKARPRWPLDPDASPAQPPTKQGQRKNA